MALLRSSSLSLSDILSRGTESEREKGFMQAVLLRFVASTLR
jgi:hypothetical protein